MKLSESKEFADNLVRAITSSKTKISELLCTPLLVTLIIISYKSSQKLPNQLWEFYDQIFYLLLQRHDGTKPGFVRHRLCSINDYDYRKIFDAFCFETKKSHLSILTSNRINEIVERAIAITNIKADTDCYLKDISNVTCLILHEGDEYRFIHKSVQEYYAASYIKSRPDTVAARFYDLCKKFEIYKNWDQELSFLSEIDEYRYNKYYLVPYYLSILGLKRSDVLLAGCPALTPDLRKRVIGEIQFGFDCDKDYSVRMFGFNDYFSQLNLINDFIVWSNSLDYSELITKIKHGDIIPKKDKIGEPQVVVVTYNLLISNGLFLRELDDLSENILTKICQLWKKSFDFVTREDKLELDIE